MAEKVFFNRGILKGELTKSELIDFNSKKGKDKFLSIEVNTGDGNRVKATVFPSKKNPTKPRDLNASYPVGTMVNVSGSVNEREYEKQNGGTAIDRSLNAFSVNHMKDSDKEGATFIIQGTVDNMRETQDGIQVVVKYDETYTPEGKSEETKSTYFTLVVPEDDADIIDELDVEVGCNAKFKGFILNQLEFDDFGDIIGSVQMFKVAKIENVISADDLEDLPF